MTIFSKIPQYQTSWKFVQWRQSDYKRTDSRTDRAIFNESTTEMRTRFKK